MVHKISKFLKESILGKSGKRKKPTKKQLKLVSKAKKKGQRLRKAFIKKHGKPPEAFF